jgi:hypothetical protein
MKIRRTFVNKKTIVLMASSFYKWLVIPNMAIVLFFNHELYEFPGSPLRAVEGLHPFHVSVVEINHNAADKTLEISCKIFTDDFEKVLARNYKTKVDLTNPPAADRKAMDSVVKKYIFSNLAVSVDGKTRTLSYLGFEKDAEAVYSYVQVDNVPSVKKVELTNKLMQDMFTDQVNIIHVIVNGERKSTKLDYPATVAKVEF